MRFCLAALLSVSSLTLGAAFTPALRPVVRTQPLASTVDREDVTVSFPAEEFLDAKPLTGTDVIARLEATLDQLREKDATSPILEKKDIKVVFEDEHIVVVNKPAGVLSVGGQLDHPNIAQAVHDNFSSVMNDADMMVVHRLGMDSSGLMIFAKTMDALRGMNTVFRTRRIERQYEALVAGHIEKDEGLLNLPLMRDYEYPPFMRVSTEKHQAILATFDPDVVGKKILEMPKESLTQYEVLNREQLDGHDVTRVTLTSISGRTHQLNVHMAAFGHPIVGDTIYGVNGDAAGNGGLTSDELEAMIPNSSRASASVPFSGTGTCVHAKSLKFRHPVTKEELELSSDAPF